MNEMLNRLGMNAKAAETEMRNLSTNKKNEVLLAVADKLVKDAQTLINANRLDVETGKRNHMPEGLIDRLLLTESRIEGMAEGLRQVSALDDPVGEVTGMKKRPNGLLIGQKRVPLGVIGIIYEARPNVTADAFALCFKTGNVVILKGGSDAIHSNEAIVNCIRETLNEQGVTEDAIQLISDTSRETAAEFMKMNQYVDVLIPRGGRGLIKAVVEQSTIPVIETGTGNCHIYVDETADLEMAADIIMNAKTQRVGVCNACESVLVHKDVKDALLPVLAKRLQEKHVEIRADEAAYALIPGAVHATEEDWGKEYLDYILSIKVDKDNNTDPINVFKNIFKELYDAGTLKIASTKEQFKNNMDYIGFEDEFYFNIINSIIEKNIKDRCREKGIAYLPPTLKQLFEEKIILNEKPSRFSQKRADNTRPTMITIKKFFN